MQYTRYSIRTAITSLLLSEVRTLLAVLALVATSGAQLTAQTTGNVLKKMFQPKSAADPMALQDKNGPWLILAQTFAGDEGKEYAKIYAKELAAHFKVPTFIHEQNSETEDVLGRGERIRTDSQGRLDKKELEVKYANTGPNKSYAVLIGEFHTKEDPQIAKLIKQVKQYQPKAKLPTANRVLFLTPNPLLPDDFFQTPAVDSFTEALNRQDWIKHSLLDCKGRFTVRVASFRGPEIVDVAAKVKTKTDEPTTALDKAATKAHQMTEALRARGIEAYEYHDKFGSYVTVGSFSSLGQEVDGQFQYEARITNIMNELCGYRIVPAKDKATGAEMRTMMVKSEEVKNKNGNKGYIPFDIEGKPIAVPKAQASKVYGGSIFK